MSQSISIVLEGIDRYSAPAQKIAKVSDKLAKALSSGVSELKSLNKQSQQLGKLQKLEKTLGKTAQEMDSARKNVKALGIEMANTKNPTRALVRDFENAKRKTSQLKQKHKEQRTELDQLKQSLKSTGLEGRNFARTQEQIRQKMDATNQRMAKMSKYSAEMERAQSRYDKTLQRSANMSLVANSANHVGRTVTNAFRSPVSRMHDIEKAKGELASVGISDLDAIVSKGQKLSSTVSGINTVDFVRAAYDIKSGISTLSDSGVASMTANAALTAKATKGDVGQMTSLFATAYGSFKESLFKNVSDDKFGGIFAAQLSKSVEAFKTDGSKMQTAIQSMGSGLAVSGISLSEQLAGLGMLQQKMDSGESGTTLKAIERSAAVAQERFAKMGYSIKTLDESGNLKSLPDLLSGVQDAFGKDYTTATGAKLLEAFGSDEAVKFFKALWGQQKAFKANADALHQAGLQGQFFTEKMAKVVDSNAGSRLDILGNKWNVIQEKIGNAFIPTLDRLDSVLSPMLDSLAGFIDKHKMTTTVVLGSVAVLGGLATVLGAVAMATAVWTATLGYTRLALAKRSLEQGLGGLTTGAGAGAGAAKASRFGKVGGMLKGKGGYIAAAGGALMLADTLTNDNLSKSQKIQDTTQTIGGVGGAMAGAAAGAIIGSAIPIVGTAIGGIVGGIAGAWAGDGLGSDAGGMLAGWFGDKPGSAIENKAQAQLAMVAQNSQQTTQAKVINNTPQFNIHQQPGESAEELAQRIIQIHQEQAMRSEYDVR